MIDVVGGLKKKLAACHKMLLRLEWRPQDVTIPGHATCPICGGIRPGPEARLYQPSFVGHGRNCSLKRLIKITGVV